jgi:hypothetical protein
MVGEQKAKIGDLASPISTRRGKARSAGGCFGIKSPTGFSDLDETSQLTPTCQRRERGANPPICQIVRFVRLTFLFLSSPPPASPTREG